MSAFNKKYLVLVVTTAAIGVPALIALNSRALDKSLTIISNGTNNQNLRAFSSAENGNSSLEKKGFLDSDGKVVIAPQYGKVIEEFKDGLAIVDTSFVELKASQGLQVVDQVSKKPPKYVRIDYEFLSSFGTNQIINTAGEIVLKSKENERFLCQAEGYVVKEVIDAAYQPRSPLAQAKPSIARSSGSANIPQPQVSPPDFTNGISVLQGWDRNHVQHLKQKLVNIKTGEVLDMSSEVKYVDCFSNGLAIAGTGMSGGNGPASVKAKQNGYIGKGGKFVIQPKFTFAQRFESNGFAATSMGFIDRAGRRVSDGKGRTIFSEGLAILYTETGKRTSTVVDATRKIAFKLPANLKFPEPFAPDYYPDDIVKFSDGLIPVIDQKTKKYGYVNRTGKVVIPPQFTSAGRFINGVALVGTAGKRDNALINVKGSTLWKQG
jgi:WG containing repeat